MQDFTGPQRRKRNSGLGFIFPHRQASARTQRGRCGGSNVMGGCARRRRSRQSIAALFRRRRALGDAVADRACGSDGIAGLFRDRLQGSPRPQGYVRRSADPFLRRCRGKYRLLHLFFTPRTEKPGFSRRATASLKSSAATTGSLADVNFLWRFANRPRNGSLGLSPLV